MGNTIELALLRPIASGDKQVPHMYKPKLRVIILSMICWLPVAIHVVVARVNS